MKKTTVNIAGMHCRSCEILIEDKLQALNGVVKTVVDHKKGTAEIYSKEAPNKRLISEVIEKAGYRLGQSGGEKKSFISKNPKDYLEIGASGVILFIIYKLISILGFTNLISSVSMKPSSLAAVLLVGVTAGFSTCMALVGGLVLGLSSSFAKENTDESFIGKFRPQIYFNIGRITSFFVLGGVIGAVGSIFALSGTATAVMTLAVALIMLTLGLQLTGLFSRLNQGLTIPKNITRLLGIGDETRLKYSNKTAVATGALTFFVPCGFTQAMQLYAISSGNFVSGALIMGIFALGTSFGLLGIGSLTSVVKGSFSKLFFRFTGVVLIVLSIFNISNSFNLLGWNSGVELNRNTTGAVSTDKNVQYDGKIQIVMMDQLSSGYSPNNFNIVKDIPVKWVINSKDPNSCAASIYSAKLGIRKNLEAGENVFEFTPKEVGQIKFSCSMGMYNGVFNVVEKNSKSTLSVDTASAADTDQNLNTNSCGMGKGCGCGMNKTKID
jgi:uncharacterized protein